MNRHIRNAALALAMIALPASVAAQDAETAACSTKIPAVHAGQVIEVVATFPHAFGEVVEVEGAIALATEEQVSMAEMANEETEEAVEMANDALVSSFWIDTHDIEPGTYALILHNEAGDVCEAEIEVQESGI